MQKYIEQGKIDLLIPESEISQTAFIEPGKFYDISLIVTVKEIKDSVAIQDKPFEFTSVCKISTEKAKIILKYPDQQSFNYQKTDIRSIIQQYLGFLKNLQTNQNQPKNDDIKQLSQEFFKVLSQVFNIQTDPIRQTALFCQINHILTPSSRNIQMLSQFLENKLISIQRNPQNYPAILF